jgi:hypothetical protein
MNKRTQGLVWIGVVVLVVVALVGGGGRALWKALLAMHGVH